MGNQQSMEKVGSVLEKGAQIYQAVKKEQNQQQHQSSQQQHQSNQQHHESSAHNESNTHHFQSGSTDDDEVYTNYRTQAHEAAQKRNDCYERSQEAYRNGDGALAKELSNQGHQHDNKMKDFNRQAAEHIYRVKNEDRPSDEIDLHGLYVQEASEKVEEAIKRCKRENADHLVIIVGKGLHSPDKIAKLKPAIIELVNKYDINCQPNTPNPGCLYVRFDGKGDMSWLNHIQEKLAGKECLIM